MIDFNDNNYRERLSRAANSPSGRIIVDYLKSVMEEFNLEKIDIDKMKMEESGQRFSVYKSIRKCLNEVLERLTNTEDIN